MRGGGGGFGRVGQQPCLGGWCLCFRMRFYAGLRMPNSMVYGLESGVIAELNQRTHVRVAADNADADADRRRGALHRRRRRHARGASGQPWLGFSAPGGSPRRRPRLSMLRQFPGGGASVWDVRPRGLRLLWPGRPPSDRLAVHRRPSGRPASPSAATSRETNGRALPVQVRAQRGVVRAVMMIS